LPNFPDGGFASWDAAAILHTLAQANNIGNHQREQIVLANIISGKYYNIIDNHQDKQKLFAITSSGNQYTSSGKDCWQPPA